MTMTMMLWYVSDVDECQEGSHECTGALMHCVNRPGTYVCQCTDGFQMNHALRVCEGIAPCTVRELPDG